MNAFIIYSNECIHLTRKPLERNTYDELILKVAQSDLMSMTSFCRYKLHAKFIAHNSWGWANCRKEACHLLAPHNLLMLSVIWIGTQVSPAMGPLSTEHPQSGWSKEMWDMDRIGCGIHARRILVDCLRSVWEDIDSLWMVSLWDVIALRIRDQCISHVDIWPVAPSVPSAAHDATSSIPHHFSQQGQLQFIYKTTNHWMKGGPLLWNSCLGWMSGI